MKRLVLILALMLVPFVVIAGASNKVVSQHEAYFYTGVYVLDEATGTSWQSYALIVQHSDGTYAVWASRRCYADYGGCNWYDLYGCHIDNAGKDVVLVANKNRVVLDIQPEDCDYDYPYGAIPVQVIWQANGTWENSLNYSNFHNRWEGPDGQQCFQRSNHGSYEHRSADVEGIFGGVDAVGTGHTRVNITGQTIYNCSH